MSSYEEALDRAVMALIGRGVPAGPARQILRGVADAARADQREKDAALVKSEAWPHERPERENEELYRLAAKIWGEP